MTEYAATENEAEPADVTAAEIDAYLAALNGQPEPTEHDSWTPLNLNTLPDQPPIQPTLGNTGLLYPGKRHVFSGPPDSAKTIGAYCVLLATIRTQRTAVLIDFEMGGYDARHRLQELGATHEELNDLLYVEPAERATPERIQTLIELRPALVVVDAAAGAYSIQGLDDNNRNDVEKLAALYVNTFWRNQIATLFIDHVVKDPEQRGRYAIGSERKLGGVDVHYGFDTIQPVSRGGIGRYKLIIHRDRGGYLKRGHLADLHLESDPDTHDITWKVTSAEPSTDEAGYFRPTHLMEKVSIDLEHRTEPVTRNTITDDLNGRRDYLLKAISALVREGFATETDGPNRSKLLKLTRHYREDDESCNPENNPSSSEVPVWFHSGSGNHLESGGSVVPPPYGGNNRTPPEPEPPEPLGWFHENGTLLDAYYDEITPELEEDT